jgi:DNA invertase Pin-like site-specific DNA recombinase
MRKKAVKPIKKPAKRKGSRTHGFGQDDFGTSGGVKPLRAGLYARVSTAHQQTLPMQLRQLREYVKRRGWRLVMEVREVKSGAKHRPQREQLLLAARRREIDAVLVWRLDRWGRSLSDLVVTLQELQDLGVAFVSLTEAFDLTTPSGRALAGMVAVFAEFEREIRRERIVAGIEQAKREGRHLGRPVTVGERVDEVRALARKKLSQSEIARQLDIPRTSVRRMLAS